MELDLNPDCEAALRAAAEQAGRTVDETVNLAVMDFVERQDLEEWRAATRQNIADHAETLRLLGE